MKQHRKKIIYGSLVILYIILIFALTFQGPKETTALSTKAAKAVSSAGYKVESKDLRSLVHIPLYFGLGVLLALFMDSLNWKWYWSTIVAVATGCAVGLADETVKIFLSTREFDLGDIGRDVIGIVIGVGVVVGVMVFGKKLKRRA